MLICSLLQWFVDDVSCGLTAEEYLTCFLSPLLSCFSRRSLTGKGCIRLHPIHATECLINKHQCTAAKVKLLMPPLSPSLSPGTVGRNESVPMQWQPPGPERLSAECPELLCRGHVAVCTSYSYPPLCAEVPWQDSQPLATIHPDAGTAGLRKGPEPARQTQAEHGGVRAGEHHTASTGNVFSFRTLL